MKPRAPRTEWVVEYLAHALMRKRPLWWTWSAHETRAAALREARVVLAEMRSIPNVRITERRITVHKVEIVERKR